MASLADLGSVPGDRVGRMPPQSTGDLRVCGPGRSESLPSSFRVEKGFSTRHTKQGQWSMVPEGQSNRPGF